MRAAGRWRRPGAALPGSCCTGDPKTACRSPPTGAGRNPAAPGSAGRGGRRSPSCSWQRPPRCPPRLQRPGTAARLTQLPYSCRRCLQAWATHQAHFCHAHEDLPGGCPAHCCQRQPVQARQLRRYPAHAELAGARPGAQGRRSPQAGSAASDAGSGRAWGGFTRAPRALDGPGCQAGLSGAPRAPAIQAAAIPAPFLLGEASGSQAKQGASSSAPFAR